MVNSEPNEKQPVNPLLSIVWRIIRNVVVRVIIFALLSFFFGLSIGFILPEAIPKPFGLPLSAMAVISVMIGIGAIVFKPSWLISSKHMRIWAPLSFFLGAFISLFLFRTIIHNILVLLWIIAAMTMGVFGISVIASVLFDILYSIIKPIKVGRPALTAEEIQRERASIRQYRIMFLFIVISFLLLIFVNISFWPVLPPWYYFLPIEPEYAAFFCPFCPFSYAKQIGMYPGLIIIGMLFGLTCAFLLSFAALGYHLERGNPIVIRKRDFLLDVSVFCSISTSILLLLSPAVEAYLHGGLELSYICILCFLYYTIKRYPWIIQELKSRE